MTEGKQLKFLYYLYTNYLRNVTSVILSLFNSFQIEAYFVKNGKSSPKSELA